MRKIMIAILMLAMMTSMAVPAFATEYNFGSGPDSGSTFGSPTSNDDPVSQDPMSVNTRRNKDAANNPPPYFYGSGDIPTDPSSLYHDNLPGGTGTGGSGTGSAVGVGSSSSGNVSLPDGMLPSTSITTADVTNTTALYYDDGSIGSLYISKLKKTIKVYEGESLENMKKGIGHFEFTSAWDGNCGFAGHNRGAAAYFGFVKDLAIGDTISYTTKYGTRTYKVYLKEKISETDYSGLGWSSDNIISLITCVENVKDQRWLVQAKEVK